MLFFSIKLKFLVKIYESVASNFPGYVLIFVKNQDFKCNPLNVLFFEFFLNVF